MNEVLRDILEGVLEIQVEKLARAREERDNLEQAFRVAQEAFQDRKERVRVIQEALDAAVIPQE